jgi:tetratricopeptide (TPR) repeat protein
VVEAIERLHADRLAEHVERLAHHGLRAEDWPRAVTYARTAGQKATSRSAYTEAKSWLEQALAHVPDLPRNRTSEELGMDIRVDFRYVLGPMAAYGSMLQHLRAAETAAQRLGDRHRLGYIQSFIGDGLRQVGEYEQAIEKSQRALSIASEIKDGRLSGVTTFNLSMIFVERGEYREATSSLRSLVSAIHSDEDLARFLLTIGLTISTFSQLGHALGYLGEFDEAESCAREGIRIAAEQNDGFRLAIGNNILGVIHLGRGEVESAIPMAERGVELARAGSFPNPLVWGMTTLGVAHSLAGRWLVGVPLLEEGLKIANSSGIGSLSALWTLWLGEAYLAAGRIADARRTILDAVDLAGAQRERGNRAFSLRALAIVEASSDPPDTHAAESRYREALAPAEALGMRPLQAHCHLGLGKLYRRVGRLEEAHIELSTAVAMLREMGMTFWLPEAESELAQSNASTLVEPAG